MFGIVTSSACTSAYANPAFAEAYGIVRINELQRTLSLPFLAMLVSVDIYALEAPNISARSVTSDIEYIHQACLHLLTVPGIIHHVGIHPEVNYLPIDRG